MQTLAQVFLRIVMAVMPLLVVPCAQASQDLYRPSEPADVVVYGHVIVTLRSTIFATSAQERAVAASGRIKDVADGRGSGVLSIDSVGNGIAILHDKAVLIALTPRDVPQGQTLQSLAQETKANIDEIINETRAFKDPTRIAVAVALSVGATLLFVLIAVATRALRRVVHRRVHARVQATMQQLHEVTGVPASRSRILTILDGTSVVVSWSILTLVGYLWLTFVLRQFPYTRAWSEGMAGWIGDTVLWLFHALLDALPGLAMITVIVVITRFVSSGINSVLRRVEHGEIKLDWLAPEIALPTRRLVTFILWVFAIAFSYPYLPGSQSEAFRGMSVVLGVMVSLGSTGVVGQAASGLIIMYTRLLRAGDLVRVQEQYGTVRKIGFFATTLSTPYRESVTIPNALLVSSNITNYTRHANGGFTWTLSVTLGYDVPWRRAHDLLMRAASMVEDVRNEPPAFVTQVQLDDHFVKYSLTVTFASLERRLEAISQLNGAIQDLFNEAELQIMSPHYIADPEQPKIIPPDQWGRR
jgi:small-conductance mechanosensitive channel